MNEIQVGEKSRLIQRPAQTNVRAEIVFYANGHEKSHDVVKFQYQEQVDGNGYKDIHKPDEIVRNKIEHVIRKFYGDAFGLAEDILQNDHGLPFAFKVENITFTDQELFLPLDLYVSDTERFRVIHVEHCVEDLQDHNDFDLMIEIAANIQPRALGVDSDIYLVAFQREVARAEYATPTNPDGWLANEIQPEEQYSVRLLTDTYLHMLQNSIGEPFEEHRISAAKKIIVNSASLHYDFF